MSYSPKNPMAKIATPELLTLVKGENAILAFAAYQELIERKIRHISPVKNPFLQKIASEVRRVMLHSPDVIHQWAAYKELILRRVDMRALGCLTEDRSWTEEYRDHQGKATIKHHKSIIPISDVSLMIP